MGWLIKTIIVGVVSLYFVQSWIKWDLLWVLEIPAYEDAKRGWLLYMATMSSVLSGCLRAMLPIYNKKGS